MNKSIEISVIIPYFTESETEILTAIHKIKSYLRTKGKSFEIIISQNGISNTDLFIKDPVVRSIKTKQKGLGIALQQAILAACGKYFYFTSSDIPFSFTDLNTMLRQYRNYDLLIGSKLHKDSIYQISFERKIISYLQYVTTNILFPRLNIRDVNGTLFANTATSQRIINENTMSDSYFFSFQFVNLFRVNSLSILEVPVTYIKVKNNTSLHLCTDTLKYFISLINLKLHIQPKKQ